MDIFQISLAGIFTVLLGSFTWGRYAIKKFLKKIEHDFYLLD